MQRKETLNNNSKQLLGKLEIQVVSGVDFKRKGSGIGSIFKNKNSFYVKFSSSDNDSSASSVRTKESEGSGSHFVWNDLLIFKVYEGTASLDLGVHSQYDDVLVAVAEVDISSLLTQPDNAKSITVDTMHTYDSFYAGAVQLILNFKAAPLGNSTIIASSATLTRTTTLPTPLQQSATTSSSPGTASPANLLPYPTQTASAEDSAHDNVINPAEHSAHEYNEIGTAISEQGNFAEAALWFRKAAEKGDPDGQFNLGRLYELGNGIAQSDTEALKWFTLAANQGENEARKKLQELIRPPSNPHSRQSSSPSQYVPYPLSNSISNHSPRISSIPLNQYVTPSSPPSTFHVSTNHVSTPADQYAPFISPSAPPVDPTIFSQDVYAPDNQYAPFSASPSANTYNPYPSGYTPYPSSSHPYAELNTPVPLAVTPNSPQTLQMAQQLISEGIRLTSMNNYTQAFVCYKSAAEMGFVDAQYTLGGLYEIGRGTPSSDINALFWFRKAANQGNIDARRKVDTLLTSARVRNDEGIKFMNQDNYKQAYISFKKSADMGFVHGQYNLARMYETGRGVDKDDDLALEWFRKAAAQGDDGAEKKIKELENKLPMYTPSATQQLATAAAHDRYEPNSNLTTAPQQSTAAIGQYVPYPNLSPGPQYAPYPP